MKKNFPIEDVPTFKIVLVGEFNLKLIHLI